MGMTPIHYSRIWGPYRHDTHPLQQDLGSVWAWHPSTTVGSRISMGMTPIHYSNMVVWCTPVVLGALESFSFKQSQETQLACKTARWIHAITLLATYVSSFYTVTNEGLTYFILPIQVSYLGIDLYIIYKHISRNTIYYYSYTFSLLIYTFSAMYTAWCLTLYHHNPIYCWALSIYNYFNLRPMPLYQSHTLLSYQFYFQVMPCGHIKM